MMVNPQEAQRIIREHFERVTLDEFEAMRDKYVDKESELSQPIADSPEESSTPRALIHTQQTA